jgi:bla regulator protein blaR1
VIESLAILSLKCRRIVPAALAALCGSIALIQPVAAGTIQSDGGTSYVLLTAGSQSSIMSGSTDDLRRARALRVGREGLFYVRQNGAAYVIRDAATLRRAEAVFEPQQALGARQAELGSRQAALGSRQAALGAEQARLGARQASASPRQAAALAHQQDALGSRQDALGRQQDALGREQDALGREQDRLGREAQGRLRTLVDEAIRRGLARRVN